MIKYGNILRFEIEEELKKSNIVYCIDKEKQTIKAINGMFVEHYVEMLNHDNSDNRFEFYIAEESEEE